jgi:hypothetical protein
MRELEIRWTVLDTAAVYGKLQISLTSDMFKEDFK